MIYYETGDYYKGSLKKGQRNGAGFYYEKQIKMTYNGQFLNDKRHGNGMLCSEREGDKYIYDGSWFEGMKNGYGQEVTQKGKYNGEWLEDMRHGTGVNIDNNGDVYEGEFKLNKRHGKGKLTKILKMDADAEDKGDVERTP